MACTSWCPGPSPADATTADMQARDTIQRVSSQGRRLSMVPTTAAIRIYLNEEHQGVVTCVHCGVTRAINMANYTDESLGHKSLKVKCNTCKKVFHIKFDLRYYPRTEVDFPGTLSHVQAAKAIDDVTITSLSLGGVAFITHRNLEIKCGDIFIIQFQLDDEERSAICEEIIIKRVDGRFVGAEFSHREKYSHELDFYITDATWDTDVV
jgi:hypothetical protein